MIQPLPLWAQKYFETSAFPLHYQNVDLCQRFLLPSYNGVVLFVHMSSRLESQHCSFPWRLHYIPDTASSIVFYQCFESGYPLPAKHFVDFLKFQVLIHPMHLHHPTTHIATDSLFQILLPI